MCSFRSGTCNWRTQLFGSSSATWIRVKHESTSKHKGYFLKANIKPDSAEKAILESPRYSSASHSCSFNFLYQIYDPSHTAALKINIEDRYGHVTNVWSSAQKNVSTDWQEGLADIGGHVMEDFKVLVEAVGDPKTTVNIDDIEFQDCAKASHSECAEDQFLCRDHASCVNNRYVCDGTPDCNDESDEDDAFCVLHEGDCDFERDFESCGWENSGEWERELVRTLENNYRTKRSTTSLFYAVADFDKARQGKPGDIASLSPKEIFPASQGKCYLRFSYRMYDPQAGVNGTEDNMGTLKVSTVNRNSVASLMWIKSGNQGRKWQKANLLLGNNDNFTVLFEAIRGDGPRSKIAINDVTFTPECRGAPSPTYNSSKTCDFTHFFCSTSNKCMPKSWLCDGKPDCGEHDEKDCPPITGQSTPATTTALSGPTSDPRPNYTKPPQTCGKGMFTCADGACIYGSLYCDGVSDCTGGEDEYGCKFQCPAHVAMLCHNGDQCGILCDSTSNCPDGSDEASCNENLCLKHHKYCYGGSNCTYTSGKGTKCLNCPLSNAGPRCYNKAELVTPSTQSSTTSTAASPCGNGKKPCKDGTCLVASKFCNFNYDCPDMSDEDSCPAVCTFEDDNTCQWQSKKCTGCFEWKLVKAEAMSPLVAPKFDHTLETKTGGFMFVESKGHLEKRERKTQLISPIFTQGGLTCSISFWFYVSCRECKLNLLVNSTAGQVVLWRWEARTPTDGEKWTLSQVVLPVCLKDFQIMIEAEMLIGWSGGIAVDDIRLEECHYKRNMFVPGYFNCTDGNYIKNDKICDFQTDCCAGNDEDTKMCTNQEIVKCDFESGWCGWQRLNGETEWIRNSGSTPSINTGPIGDHTYRTTNGYYLYVESSRPAVLNDKARIGLYLNRTSTKEPCQVRFWYHMYGEDVHTLSFYVKNFTSEPKLLAQAVGEKGNEWLRANVDISEPGPFQVIIEAVIGNSYMGDIAIDDFSYKGCSIYTGPTPSVTPTHVTMTPIKYPTNCHFEINSCNWHEFYQDNFDWHWGSGHSTLNERNRAPRIDHSRGSANGHYMYVKDNAGGNSATSRNAFLRSETFQTTSSECKIQFYYYLNTTKTDRTTDTRLGLTIIQHEQNNPEKASLIWQQAKNMGAQWNRAVVGVGRRSEPFMFEFVCYGIGAESRIVAIDDIIFYDCTLGEPTNSCDQQTMFHCPKTKVCLQRNFLCDLTDQCGEREDEAENLCEGYKQQNFENDLGDFYQGKDGTDDDFNWIRRNGSTPSFDTGPDTDHTLYTNSGHYIHIESSKPRKAGEKAWLLSHVFTATNQKEPCNMRFFRHMYGENVDRLAVYVRYSRSGPGSRLIWEAQGEAGNFWSRVEVVLDEKDDFQVIFEGRVGTGWKGDIAIDDISFTPGCKYSDTPLPQDKAVDDDLNEGQSHDVAIAVPVTIILLAIIVVTVILLARRQRTLRMEQKNSNLYSSTRDITVDNPTFEAESGMQQIVNPLYDRSRDKTPRKL